MRLLLCPSRPSCHRMRDHLRTRYYSIRTEAVYLNWVRWFIQ